MAIIWMLQPKEKREALVSEAVAGATETLMPWSLHSLQQDATSSTTAVTWSVCCCIANLAICFLGYWRCFANNYLHWAAVCTWVLFNVQGKSGLIPSAFDPFTSKPLLPPICRFYWRGRRVCQPRVPGLVHAVRHLCAVCDATVAAQVVRCGRHHNGQLSPGRNYHQEIAGHAGKASQNCFLFFVISHFMPHLCVSLAAATGCQLRGLSDHSQFHTVHGHQCGRHVYQIFDRSRTTFGLHRDAQGDGA